LNARIIDLDRRVQQLSLYIDHKLTDLTPEHYLALFSLQGRLTSRLGRLMRDRQITTSAIDDLDAAIEEALKLTSALLETDLLPGQNRLKKRTLTPPK